MTLERNSPAAVFKTDTMQRSMNPRRRSAAVLFVRARMWACAMIAAAVGVAAGAAARAGSETLKVTDAWVPAVEKTGGDIPLSMTIRNESSSPDALMRVRCPAANFSEKHTVDRGEGAPAMRAIPSIPLAADSTVTLKRDGYHVMLLQTRQRLDPGEKFTCAIDFQKAGTIETEVQVR